MRQNKMMTEINENEIYPKILFNLVYKSEKRTPINIIKSFRTKMTKNEWEISFFLVDDLYNQFSFPIYKQN